MEKIATTDQIPDQGMISVKTSIGPVCLVSLNGKILAFEDRCSHDDGPLSNGKIKGNCVVCPRHAAEFDMHTGDVIRAPATAPIEVFPVHIEGNEVHVNLD